MKLTNPETIQESEKDFIDAINAELDWEAIEQMLLEKHSFTLQEEIDYKEGDLVVFNNDIAYKFDFEIKVPLSVIFNRQGECLEISTVREDYQDLEDMEDESDDDAFSSLEEPALDDAADIDEDAESGDLEPADEEPSADTGAGQDERVAQMASDIADMITEINESDDQQPEEKQGDE